MVNAANVYIVHEPRYYYADLGVPFTYPNRDKCFDNTQGVCF